MKKVLFALLFAVAVAQPGLSAPARDAKTALLGQRLFPTLTQIDPSTETAAEKTVLTQRRARWAACGADAACKVAAATWSETDMTAVANGASAARAAVRRELVGLNAILAVYGQGATPRYPKIDGPDAAADPARFKKDVATAVALSEIDDAPAFDRSVNLALALLDVADRLDAVAFEPLTEVYNRDAAAYLKTVAWQRYRYTAIVVLGIGPDDLVTPLSALGKLNVRLAAKRYFAGDAPLIVTTGAMVHPRGAHFAEAVEMRRALIERYHVPAEAILIEPYARHTTTNLRNVTRIMMALGVPLDRDALVLSNPEHSRYVESEEFKARNLHELGYEPGKIGARLSPFEVAFRPNPQSIQIDPLDPLDP